MVGSCRRRAGHRACPCTKEPTMGGSSTARYATSALRAAQRTFALVTAEPTNLYLRGEDFGDDLPAGPIALPRLRDLLLAASTSLSTRDAVWREVVERAPPAPPARGSGAAVGAAGLPAARRRRCGGDHGRRGEPDRPRPARRCARRPDRRRLARTHQHRGAAPPPRREPPRGGTGRGRGHRPGTHPESC